MGENAPSIEDVIDKFEYTLVPTQDVIESVSKWCLDRRQNHETIVKAWLALFYISGDPMRLSLLFLMNDVCQRERHLRCNKFRKAFMQKIKTIVLISRSKSLLPHLARIVKIWEERNVFGKELINELRVLSSDELLNERSASVASLAFNDLGQSSSSEPTEYDSSYLKLLQDFNKPALVKAVRYYAEDKTVWLSPRNDPRGCIEKSELLKCMRDRERGRRTMSDVNKAFNRYYDAVDAHRMKVVHLNKLVACLELAGIFYLTQGHEASMVCAAYHSFGERLASMAEECSDLLEKCSPSSSQKNSDHPQGDGKSDSPQVASSSASVEEDPLLAQQIKAVLTAMRKEEDNEAVDMELEDEEEEQRGCSFVSLPRGNIPLIGANPLMPLPGTNNPSIPPPQAPLIQPPVGAQLYSNQWRPAHPPAQPRPMECDRPAPVTGSLPNWPRFVPSNFDFRMPPQMMHQWQNFVPPRSPMPGGGLPRPLGNRLPPPQEGEQQESFLAGGHDQEGFGGPPPPKVFAQAGFDVNETDVFPNGRRGNAGKTLLPAGPFQKPGEPIGNVPAEFNGSRGQPGGHFTNDGVNPEEGWTQHNAMAGEDATDVGMAPSFTEPMDYPGQRVGPPPLGPLPSGMAGPPSEFVGSAGPPPLQPVGHFEDTTAQEGSGEMLPPPPPPPYMAEANNPMISDSVGPRHGMAPGPRRGLMYPRPHFQGQRPFGNRAARPFEPSMHRMRAPGPLPFRGPGSGWSPRPFRATEPLSRWSSVPAQAPPTNDDPAWEQNVPYGSGVGVPNHMVPPVRHSLLERPPRDTYPRDFSVTRFAPVPPGPLPLVRGGSRRNFRRM